MYREAYLQHYGILGMKWGVRRFQNPDGSLTPEGRIHYGADAKEMTDDQLNNIAKRNNLERQYYQSIVDRNIAVANYNKMLADARKSPIRKFFEGPSGKRIREAAANELQKSLTELMKSWFDKKKDDSWQDLVKKASLDMNDLSDDELAKLGKISENYKKTKNLLDGM